jgi:transposase
MKITHSIGLDIHKSSARYHILDDDSHRVSRGPLRAETAAVEQLLDKLSADPATILVVAEATGMLHLDFCQAFEKAGCQVVVINPLYKCNRTSKNAIRDNKTDRLDAEALAELGLQDQHDLLRRFRYRCPVEFFKLQRYESTRQILRKSLTNIIKHTATTVHTLFPELDALELSLKSVSVRRLLRDHPGPARIAALQPEELRGYVGDKALALQQAAAHSFANDAMVAACEEGLLAALLDSIEQLEEKIEQLDQKIEQLLLCCVDDQTVELARSIPGFGPKTTPAILAFIAPEHLRGGKRKIARRLQALFGADPRIKESGRWKGQTKISKRGSRIARTALFQAAFCGMTHDPQLRVYYDSLKARGKNHKQAIVDLMRKQLQRLVSVLVDQKSFTHIPA